jgi:hypothetical protein
MEGGGCDWPFLAGLSCPQEEQQTSASQACLNCPSRPRAVPSLALKPSQWLRPTHLAPSKLNLTQPSCRSSSYLLPRRSLHTDPCTPFPPHVGTQEGQREATRVWASPLPWGLLLVVPRVQCRAARSRCSIGMRGNKRRHSISQGTVRKKEAGPVPHKAWWGTAV